MSLKNWAAVGLLLLGFSSGGAVRAHERSESFSHWSYADGVLHGVITVRTREVTRLTLPGEDTDALPGILLGHVAKEVSAKMDGHPCVQRHAPLGLEAEPGYLRIAIDINCAAGTHLDLDIGLFFDVTPTHHHFAYLAEGGGTGARNEAILDVSAHQLNLVLGATSGGGARSGARFWPFVAMGIEHIAGGIDHLAFLLALLLTVRNRRQILWIVTGFTVGHSVSLSLAVFGVVETNRGAVESLIGLTIALAAARNLIQGEREGRAAALGACLIVGALMLVPSSLRPDMPAPLLAAIALGAASAIWRGSLRSDDNSVRARVIMALGFGLIHGLGFARALQDLHLPQSLLVRTLIGFNVGVEIGQLAAVTAAALAARAVVKVWPRVGASTLPAHAASAALLAIGTAWFLTRAVAALPPS